MTNPESNQSFPNWFTPLNAQERKSSPQPTTPQYPDWFTPVAKDPEASNLSQLDSAVDEGARFSGGLVARGVEAAAGGIPNLVRFASTLPQTLREGGQAIGKSITGGISNVLGITQERQDAINKRIEDSPKFRPDITFGSESLRENVTKPLTGERFEPKSEEENIAQNIAGDFASVVASPGSGLANLGRKAFTAIASNLASEGVKAFGADEKTQLGTKIITSILAGTRGRQTAKENVAELYTKANASIPKDTYIRTSNIQNQLKRLKTDILRGGRSSDKDITLNLINDRLRLMEKGNGRIKFDEIPASRVTVNEIRYGSTPLSPAAHRHLSRYDTILNNKIDEYGKRNPQYLRLYRDANLGHSALEQSNRLARQVSKHVDVNNLDPTTLLLLGIHSPRLLKTLAILPPAAITLQVAQRFRNPVIQRHYMNILNASSSENAGQLNKAILDLNKSVVNP
jgi:hypothetical protein